MHIKALYVCYVYSKELAVDTNPVINNWLLVIAVILQFTAIWCKNKTCCYISKANCAEPCKKRTVPCKKRAITFPNRNVLCKKRNVPFTKWTLPCKKRAMIVYARPAPKRPIKHNLPCNKRATFWYGLIDLRRSMKTEGDCCWQDLFVSSILHEQCICLGFDIGLNYGTLIMRSFYKEEYMYGTSKFDIFCSHIYYYVRV